METKDIINGLVTLNKWRRGEVDEMAMPHPWEIGILIDAAAERLGKLEGQIAAEKAAHLATSTRYDSVFQSIAKSIGIESPMVLIGMAKNNHENFAEILARAVGEFVAKSEAEHLATQRALVAVDDMFIEPFTPLQDHVSAAITAAREAVAKANAEAATKGNK